ncbi:ABC-type nitrate/sulfonate/bicarbonate transport system ATPase subunit [Streptomyces sp. B3I7]|uniref:ABC transporter ATP-binding protein n=1 Tax=Streptomyces sp. B3I7 TaxID=3042269 RepID=UPI002788C9EA|nr:ABC transporter ATP-binding protein [Streptomyces sp. B3I7]MDQ0809086.1 ABC-type nitrate/sulfonate/bicarbonate transport system ATPase subunit [Streptomyces sp. B3I7]
MLRLDSVGQRYGDHPVLRDLTLTVPDGQLLCVAGPSGCGKSTLLRTLAGLLPAAEGTVSLDGTPVTGVPDRLAVVFQDYGRSLLPWLTVLDNVALPLRRRSLRRAERRAEAARMLERVGLAGTARRHPWQLSGGMQQRVALARALVCRPALLLLDEPFGSLDAQTREDLEDLLREAHRAEGTTTVLVTHDIDESVYVGDRVVVLSPGPAAHVVLDLPVELPVEREQITTRGCDAFVALRAKVGRAVRAGAGG